MRIRIGDLDLPPARIVDLIAIAEEAFEFERAQLLADLDAAGSDPETRMEKIRELSLRKGTGSLLIMATFRLDMAHRIVRGQLNRAAAIAPIDVEAIIAGLRHDEMVSLAQRFMGYREPDPEVPPKAAGAD